MTSTSPPLSFQTRLQKLINYKLESLSENSFKSVNINTTRSCEGGRASRFPKVQKCKLISWFSDSFLQQDYNFLCDMQDMQSCLHMIIFCVYKIWIFIKNDSNLYVKDMFLTCTRLLLYLDLVPARHYFVCWRCESWLTKIITCALNIWIFFAQNNLCTLNKLCTLLGLWVHLSETKVCKLSLMAASLPPLFLLLSLSVDLCLCDTLSFINLHLLFLSSSAHYHSPSPPAAWC